MPRKCYWTRQLELDLVNFVRQREFIWKPIGNTNHHIQQKYKAYAEFAEKLGIGFTARSVRDRWVNIRSTFNHNLRKVDRSRGTAQTESEVYVPCWPLWYPLQFLRETTKDDANYDYTMQEEYKDLTSKLDFKQEKQSNFDLNILCIRQQGQRTNRPRRKIKNHKNKKSNCKEVLDDLVKAMSPLLGGQSEGSQYWFFGKHVTERLNAMRPVDADSASDEIMKLLEDCSENKLSIDG